MQEHRTVYSNKSRLTYGWEVITHNKTDMYTFHNWQIKHAVINLVFSDVYDKYNFRQAYLASKFDKNNQHLIGLARAKLTALDFDGKLYLAISVQHIL